MGIRLGGRQKGTPNKATGEVRQLALKLFDKDYWRSRKQLLKEGKLAPILEAKLLSYAYGEPKQERVANTGLTVNIGYFGDAKAPQVIDVTPQREMIATALVAPDGDAGESS